MKLSSIISKTIITAATIALLTVPATAGYGPGDGTGNGGIRPKDGSGYGSKKGSCLSSELPGHEALILSRRGNGGGGYGPGDGTGNGGNGPKDGTGRGKKNGTCINS